MKQLNYNNIFLILSILVPIFSFSTIKGQNTSIFQYDNLNRLNQIEYNGNTISIIYDAVGNRINSTITINPNSSRTNLKAFLEGCYSNGQMLTLLNSTGFIPKDQPFNISPWNYSGSESVSNIPSTIVDWVLIEIRTGLLENTKVAVRATFLKNDGAIVDLDGTSQVSFNTIEAGDYYVVIRHRNHLDIMSSSPVTISSGSSTLYDFTTSQTKAYGNSPMKALGDGNFGMYAGDADADGNVDYVSDVLIYWVPNFGLDGYYPADFNMNGTVEYTEDLLNLWVPNFGFSSQVPGSSLALPLNIRKQFYKDNLIIKRKNKTNGK